MTAGVTLRDLKEKKTTEETRKKAPGDTSRRGIPRRETQHKKKEKNSRKKPNTTAAKKKKKNNDKKKKISPLYRSPRKGPESHTARGVRHTAGRATTLEGIEEQITGKKSVHPPFKKTRQYASCKKNAVIKTPRPPRSTWPFSRSAKNAKGSPGRIMGN